MPPPRLGTLAREPTFDRKPQKSGSMSTSTAGPWLAGWGGVMPGSTGVPVNPFSALQAAAVYACVKRLSEDVGKLPLRVRRRLRKGGFREDYDHPLNRLFRRPNEWQTASQCWSYYVWALALRGNAYAPVIRGRAGEPTAIVPVSPDRVSPLLTPDGRLWYQVSHPYLGEGLRLDQGNVLHAKGMTFDGYTGVSPIMLAQDVVGLSLATQQHGATLFRQGAQIAGVLEVPNKLSTEAAQRMATSWSAAYGGVQNANKVAVLEEGTKFAKIAMTNEDAQFLASRQFSVVEICRLFGVPPHKVFDLSNAHFSNIENSEQQYINDTLVPIARQVEEVLEQTLLWDDEQGEIDIRFDFNELLRGDRLTRVQAQVLEVNNGLGNPNEARIEEGKEPYEGGWAFRVPLNTGDAGAKPAATAPAPDAGQPMPADGTSGET